VQPLLEVEVGHADGQEPISPGEPGPSLEPETITRLTNPATKDLLQRRHGFALSACQGLPPAHTPFARSDVT
jgi:hypothetical protein